MAATPRAANPPSRLNRAVLTVLGLLLVLAGAFVLVFGLGLLTGVLPALDPGVPVLPAGTPAPWAPWVATVVAVLVGLACLRWLVAQARRRPRTTTWSLPGATGSTGATTLPADAAAAAVAADVEGYRGVRKVSATLAGTRAAPALQLDVTTEEHTGVAELRERISTHALPRLRGALQLDALPTQLLLRVDAASSTAPRAR